MSTKNDAAELNQGLKESQRSARGLALEMLGVQQGLGKAVTEAARLGEAMAKVSKIEGIAGAATGIGVFIAVIGTAIALTVGFHEKTKELHNEWLGIVSEAQKYNALAANDQRAAKLIEINAEQVKAHEELEKEKGLIGEVADKLDEIRKKGGLLSALIPDNVHVFDYAAISRAIDERAAARRKEVRMSAERATDRTALDIQDEAQRNFPTIAAADPYTQQIVQNELARKAQKRKQEQSGQDAGMNPEEIQYLVSLWDGVFDNIADSIYQGHIKQLGDQLGQSFASSIADGIAKGVESGSLQQGFKSLLGGLLIGFGNLMISIGTESLLAANLMQGIIEALYSFAPLGAVGPALALIALGGVLVGLGGALGGRGGGKSYGGSGASSGGTTIIDRGLINPVTTGVTSPGKIVPINPVTNQIFLIGKDDPRAQRDLFDMVNSAAKRQGGSIG